MELFSSFELDASGARFESKGFYKKPLVESAVGLKDNPLHIQVNSDTDWAVVAPSAASVVVALIVAWLTVRVQKNQIASNLSNFRHQWMVELRTCASEYLQAIVTRAVKVESTEGFLGSPESFEIYRRITVLTLQFEMLLSRNDEETKRLFDLDNKIMDMLYKMKSGDDSEPVINLVNEMKELLRSELESAWLDVKRDVGKKT